MKFSIIMICIMSVLHPVASMLERKGMSQMGEIGGIGQMFRLETLFRIVTNPYVITGVCLSILGLLLWLTALSSLDVSYAYPFQALTYLVVAVLGVLVLHEPVTASKGIGIAVIMLGIIIASRG